MACSSGIEMLPEMNTMEKYYFLKKSFSNMFTDLTFSENIPYFFGYKTDFFPSKTIQKF